MHTVLLRDEDAGFMRATMQAALVDLAHASILGDDELAERDQAFQVEVRARRHLGLEQPVGSELRLLGSQRPDTDGAHVVHMRDDEHAGQQREESHARLPLFLREIRERCQ